MTTVSISHKLLKSHCSVTVRATELAERKLDFELTDSTDLKKNSGDKYEHDLIRYLCGEGLSHARRRLELSGGISAEIQNLSGTVCAETENGVSLAIAIAIAKEISKDDNHALLKNHEAWEASTTKL